MLTRGVRAQIRVSRYDVFASREAEAALPRGAAEVALWRPGALGELKVRGASPDTHPLALYSIRSVGPIKLGKSMVDPDRTAAFEARAAFARVRVLSNAQGLMFMLLAVHAAGAAQHALFGTLELCAFLAGSERTAASERVPGLSCHRCRVGVVGGNVIVTVQPWQYDFSPSQGLVWLHSAFEACTACSNPQSMCTACYACRNSVGLRQHHRQL